MAIIYLVSEGVPERRQILGEVPIQRCVEEFGLDPLRRVQGLRESGATFDHGASLASSEDDGQLVVAGIGLDEARDGLEPGYYWLDLSPNDARRRLA